MVIERKTTNIRAFDNRDPERRVVVNYSSVAHSDDKNTWSSVDKFYVHSSSGSIFGEFYINVATCEIVSTRFLVNHQLTNTPVQSGLANWPSPTDQVSVSWFSVKKIGDIGQREILFETKDDSFKMLFEHRNKSLRVIKNSYLTQNIKGSMFKRNHVKLDSLDYVEEI